MAEVATDLNTAFRDALLDFLAPLDEAAQDPVALEAWLAQLGHTAAISGAPEVSGVFAHAGDLRAQLAAINPDTLESLSGLRSLLQSGREVSGFLQDLREFANDPARAQIAGTLGEDVMALLLASYLRRNHMTLFRVASILTLIEPSETSPAQPAVVQDGDTLRYPSFRDQFKFAAVSALISKPGETLHEFYFPNDLANGADAWLAATRLFGNLGYLTNAIGVAWRTQYQPSVPPPATPPGDDEVTDGGPDGEADDNADDGTVDGSGNGTGDGSGDGTDPQDDSGQDSGDDEDPFVPVPLTESYFASCFPGFRFVLLAPTSEPGSEVAIEVQCSSSSHPGATPGYIVSLVGTFNSVTTFDSWRLTLTANGQIPAFVLKPSGFDLVSSAVPLTGGSAKILLERLAADGGGPAFLFGSAGGTHLEVGSTIVEADFSYDPAHIAAAISAKAAKCSFVIKASDGDGFLSSVLPADGLKADFDLGLTFSSDGGLSVQGAAGLDATLPIGVSIGGVVTIPSIHLGLQAQDTGLQAEVSASLTFSIGPVQAVVDRLGVIVPVTFPANGGNFGPMDLDFAFKPPSGVGLSIDAAGVGGGGFLKHDDAKHEYSGMLQLEFTELALQAFGLITTEVAGGQGYSLLALIDAEFPPIQLGWGFTLNGVGGLLAVNRSASTDALHAALKANTLSSILFPKNALTNAPQILAELDALFPTAAGRFLFGPMALIGWGSPTLLTAAIAIVIELPEPIRIILIARLSANLPSEDNKLIRINMDALGVLDLGQDSLSLDATLFDSKLLDFTLSGDMALRANWASSQREFLLAVGGYHPQFTPPAGFPTLQRMTINMTSGSVAKLRLATYLAVSANTVQFGATLDAFIGVSGFGLTGHLGFDALLQLEPLHFDADISGQMALTAGGDDLMSVGLEATLSGPAPWHIAGDFKVHIVFFDVQKHFSESWGDDAGAPQIVPVEVLPLLTAALADARNWGAALPAGTPALVSLAAATSVVHPLARLEVHESVVPLGLTITRYGAAGVTGATSFTLGDYAVNGTTVDKEVVEDDFAPAQFFELSEEEKLARPSFETHDAGVRLKGTGLVKCGAPISKDISYETFYIDQAGAKPRSDEPAPPPIGAGDLEWILAIGASGRAAIRGAGNRRYTAPGTPVKVMPQSFVIAARTTLALAGIGAAQGTTYSDAKATLQAALSQNPAARPTLQIISIHEMPIV